MSMPAKHLLVEIEIFIAKLEKETGVSKRFLEAARPSIERAFIEVPKERRLECLEAIEMSCKNQAETEKSVEKSLESAKRLAVVEQKLTQSLAQLKAETQLTRDRMTATAFHWGLKQDDRWNVN